VSAFPKASAHAFALNACEKTMRPVRRNLKITTKCRIAVDRGRVVDKTYRRAWKLLPLSVEVDIFDAESGKLQRTKAVFRDRVIRYRGLTPARAQFRVVANGIDICQGTYEPRGRVSIKVVYKATCFGERFSGRSNVNKLRRVDGIYVMTPQKVRLTSGSSWMEMRF
jgi:hypothetical protein